MRDREIPGRAPSGRTRILVADDHRVIRAGLRRIMEAEEDLDICGEAEDAEEVLRLVRERRWDVLILDLSLPDRSGLDILEEVRELQPEMRVLVLTMHEEPGYVRRAFSLGATGYISKDCAADEVVEAVREVARGGRYLGRFLARKLGLGPEDLGPGND